MPKTANRVAVTTSEVGTGTFTLGGSVTGHQSFSDAYGTVGNTDTFYGILQDSSGEWEVGIGTFLGPSNQIQRDTVLGGTNGPGSKVNFPAGSKTVYVPLPAEVPLVARARRASDVALELRSTAGQSGNLLEAYSSASTLIAWIAPSGAVVGVTGGFGNLYIGALPTGAVGANRISTRTGSQMVLQSGVSTDAMINFFAVDGTTTGRIDADDTNAAANTTLITRRKGDTRYLRANTDTTLTGLGTASSGLTIVNGHLNLPIQGAVQFLNSATRIQPTALGAQIQFFIDTTLAARVEPAGTSVPTSTSVITREKGDNRYQTTSSARFKESITTADDLAAVFPLLSPKAFVWGGEISPSDERYGTPAVGFIAEEVAVVMPEAARYVRDDDGEMHLQAIDHAALIAVLHAKIEELETRLAALEGQP